MFKSAKLLIPVLALALVIAGCDSEKAPMQSNQNLLALSGAFELPAGATLESATFNVYSGNPTGQHVNAHRITAPWEEMTVTWNSFDSAFAVTPEGGFNALVVQWESVDVTSLVQSWLDGTYPNYGILLDQDILEWPRTLFYARELGENPAYLHVCYELNGQSTCVDVTVEMDTYIMSNEGNTNYGAIEFVFTGRYAEGEPEKWALFYFDMTVDEPELACIGDRVWYDTNCDGIQDEGEMGAAGITVHLMDCEGGILETAVTDASGNYLFCDLAPGSYNIHFVMPAGFYAAPQNVGVNDALDSDADGTTGMTACTELVAGETDLTWDLGLCEEMETGCTRTPGYWKTHAGFGPQADVVTQYLPLYLGTMGGAKTITVNTAAKAVEILDVTWGSNSNGILKLYRNLLAAKLNLAAGASGADLGTKIADADAWLANHDWTEWDSLSRSTKNMILGWSTLFDEYNNGCIGPGHCGDDPYGEDCDDDPTM